MKRFIIATLIFGVMGIMLSAKAATQRMVIINNSDTTIRVFDSRNYNWISNRRNHSFYSRDRRINICWTYPWHKTCVPGSRVSCTVLRGKRLVVTGHCDPIATTVMSCTGNKKPVVINCF